MKYTITSNGIDPGRDQMISSLIRSFEHDGWTHSTDVRDPQFVLNPVHPDHPKPYRRRSRSVFVISIARISEPPSDLKAFCYTLLIRSLSNMFVCLVAPDDSKDLSTAKVYFTTPEAGFYCSPYEPQRVYDQIRPIATARYATKNELVHDLPEAFWNGSPTVDALRRYGAELDSLGVLPTPFPLHELLPEQDLRHLFKIFGMTGLSYGNLSAREQRPGLNDGSFWMTARGVDKSRLGSVGEDLLLVRTFSFDKGVACLSMPPDGSSKARVSVDAVEHAMIYQRYPRVGAIVHVHAWMDDIISTRQNFPCGTQELAQEVSDMLARSPDPSEAVIGLKNHGITVTGPDLENIFDRLRGHLRTEVPMYA